VDALKKAAATAAVDLVPPNNTIIGLGSGSTLAFVIRELGERVRQGRLRIMGVPTSYQARFLAKECGIPIQDAIDTDHVDLAIDGADEVDPAGNLIKGAGGAHVMEKLIAAWAHRFIVVVDETKLVQTLGRGRYPLPVEVIAPAMPFVMRRLQELGGKPSMRNGSGKLEPVISDLGHPIIDVDFGPIADAAWLNQQLNGLPGVVGHGLFIGMANKVIVARSPVESPKVEILDFPRTVPLGIAKPD
jgi:ribose 5-phosphate isomerase A